MNIDLLLTAAISALNHAGEINAAIQTARNENRDVTDEECAALAAKDDAARAALVDAIAKAKAEGR